MVSYQSGPPRPLDGFSGRERRERWKSDRTLNRPQLSARKTDRMEEVIVRHEEKIMPSFEDHGQGVGRVKSLALHRCAARSNFPFTPSKLEPGGVNQKSSYPVATGSVLALIVMMTELGSRAISGLSLKTPGNATLPMKPWLKRNIRNNPLIERNTGRF